MGRHAVRRRRRRVAIPWVAVAVLGLVAGATVTSVLWWGGAVPGVAVTAGAVTAVGAGLAQVLAARLPVEEPDPPGEERDPGPDAVP